MGDFFTELKRRHVFRCAAAYAVVAWLLLQVVNNVAPVLDLPPWIARSILLLLALGFPIALVAAWFVDLKTGASAGESQDKINGIDWVIAGALVAVIAIFAYQELAYTRGTNQPQQANLLPAGAPADNISVAVLPFANVSGDTAQEFFSDGMTDEIMLALTKVPDLRVVARTSAFQFKGQNRDVGTIGQSLHASHVIEGSVRKEGDRLRITAQLIRTDNGLSLWSESYDRQLTGVFAIQEDIAQAIAGALRVPLGLKQGESLVTSRTGDTASYQDYLRARALWRLRGLKSLTDAANLLEQVVARDPGYAPAWALLALAHEVMPDYHPAWFSGDAQLTRAVVEASLPKAEAAARHAVQLDPKNADGYEGLALHQAQRGHLLAAEELYLKALSLDPNNPDTLHQYSQLLAEVGRLDEAIAMRQRLQTLEPLVPVFNTVTATFRWIRGEEEAAIAALRELPSGFTLGRSFLARAYASGGRFGEAADALAQASRESFLPGTLEEAVGLLRSAPAPAGSPQRLRRLGILEFAYLYVKAETRVLEWEEGNVEAGYTVPATIAFLWHASYAPVRKTERYKSLARNVGLVEYWRAKGWPKFCRPSTGEDFICE